MAVEQSTQSLIRKKSCPILEYWRPISSLSEVLLTPHSWPPRPQGGFPHWKQSTWILIRKNSCPISEYWYIADFQSPIEVLCNARLFSIYGHRLQFEGPLDPTLIQTEFFVHDKVQMDLTGQLSQSFKNIGNQDFFFKQDFYNTATTVYWNRFFQPVAFNFPMGKPPLRPQRPAVCSQEDFTEAGNRPPIFRYRCVLQQWHRPSAPISDIEKISTMSRERHEMVGCPKNTSYSSF